MKTVSTIVKFYVLGIIFTAFCILCLCVFGYFTTGYFKYPEISNLIINLWISGLPFGIAIYSLSKVFSK